MKRVLPITPPLSRARPHLFCLAVFYGNSETPCSPVAMFILHHKLATFRLPARTGPNDLGCKTPNQKGPQTSVSTTSPSVSSFVSTPKPPLWTSRARLNSVGCRVWRVVCWGCRELGQVMFGSTHMAPEPLFFSTRQQDATAQDLISGPKIRRPKRPSRYNSWSVCRPEFKPLLSGGWSNPISQNDTRSSFSLEQSPKLSQSPKKRVPTRHGVPGSVKSKKPECL